MWVTWPAADWIQLSWKGVLMQKFHGTQRQEGVEEKANSPSEQWSRL